MGGARALTIGVAAFAAVAAWPAAGAAWERPVHVGDTGGYGPSVAVDGHGVTRVFASDRGRTEMRLLKPGRRRASRVCHVPHVGLKTGVDGWSWATNAAGAVAVGISYGPDDERHRVAISSAAPGRCFGPRQLVSKRGTYSFLGRISIGARGSLVAAWGENPKGTPHRYWASGRAGGKLHKRGAVPEPEKRGFEDYAYPTVVAGERTVWTWLTSHVVDTDAGTYLERVWISVSRAAARRIAKPRAVASKIRTSNDKSLTSACTVTFGRGGQLMAWNDHDALHVRTRRPGGAFGRARSVHSSADTIDFLACDANDAGDTVIAWEDAYDVWAMMRRRGGRLVGPQLLSPGETPRYSAEPTVAIDGRGRAVVAFFAKDNDPSQIEPTAVRAAMSRRNGRFRPAQTISGPKRQAFVLPISAAANAAGRVSVAWLHVKDTPRGIVASHVLVARGRLRD